MEITALDIARRFLGQKEVPGAVSNPLIASMLRIVDSSIHEDETPWCSAYVNFVAWICGLCRSKSLSARSWLNIGMPISLNNATPGFDVVIFKRGEGHQPGPEVLQAPGHVAFFVSIDGDKVTVLGGNQGDCVSTAKFPIANILGIRRLAPVC